MSELLKAVARQSMVHNLQIRTVQSPVAGSDFVIVVPSPEDWRVIGVRATLTTSAAVANRVPEIVYDDQTNIGAGVVAMTTQPASTAVVYNFACLSSAFSTGALATGAKANIGIGEWILPTAYRLRVITTAIDAADQWSAITVSFERMDEPPYRQPLIGTQLDEDVQHEIAQQLNGG